MQDIKESDVAGENRQRPLHIMQAKFDIFVLFRGDFAPVTDLSRIDIQSEHRLPAGALAEIKRQQTDAASDIQDRVPGRAQQFIRGRINLVVAQFAADIMAEPALLELRGHSRTRIYMVRRVSYRGFHLLRIIALPD